MYLVTFSCGDRCARVSDYKGLIAALADRLGKRVLRVDESEIDKSLLDEVGAWTILKHDIVQYYATTYSAILENFRKKNPNFNLTYYYIDGYANTGHIIEKATGKVLEGSALRVLNQVEPAFAKYFFVELEKKRFEELRKACNGHQNVMLYNGDANDVLPREVFPEVQYSRFERAFCLLDPYKETTLAWDTVKAAATTGTIDVLIHFPIYSMNINVLRKDGEYTEDQRRRLRTYWGDDSWEDAAYRTDTTLFGWKTKRSNEEIVAAYSERLVKVGRFLGASKPIPMKNGKGNVIYYLVFASSNETGVKAIRSVANHFIKQLKAD